MVKNAREKRAARRYQIEHPGISYRQALHESREEYERTESTKHVVPRDDDTAHTVDQPPSSHYLTNPFGLQQNNDVDEQR